MNVDCALCTLIFANMQKAFNDELTYKEGFHITKALASMIELSPMDKLHKQTMLLAIILDGLAVLFVIVLLCLGLYKDALLSFTGVLLAASVPLTTLIYTSRNLSNKTLVLLISFLRLGILMLAGIVPGLLWYFIPAFHETVHIFFLFPGLILAGLYYLLLRVVYLITDLKNK